MRAKTLPDLRPAPVRWRPPVDVPPRRPSSETPAPKRGDGVDPAMAALVRAIAEVCTGQRAPAMLGRWADEDVLAGLTVRHATWDRPLSLVGLRAQHDSDGAEVAVHARAGTRHHAVALRLERVQGRWCCTQADWAPSMAAGADPSVGPR